MYQEQANNIQQEAPQDHFKEKYEVIARTAAKLSAKFNNFMCKPLKIDESLTQEQKNEVFRLLEQKTELSKLVLEMFSIYKEYAYGQEVLFRYNQRLKKENAEIERETAEYKRRQPELEKELESLQEHLYEFLKQ